MRKIFLDTSVFIDFFTDSKRQTSARKHMEKVQTGRVWGVTDTTALMETKYHLRKMLGHERAEEAYYILSTLPHLQVIPLTLELGALAADIRFRYFDKKKKPISFADAVYIASSMSSECDALVTSDFDFKDIQEVNIEMI